MNLYYCEKNARDSFIKEFSVSHFPTGGQAEKYAFPFFI
jgi:hypothetical protein